MPAGPGEATHDPTLMDRADEQAEALLETLKDKVQTESKDVGVLRKELRVTVPGEVIHERLSHDFNEIRTDAVLPGFRKGHAPLKLVQKRFAPDVRKTLKTSIIGQSFMAALDKEKFEALGDPLFQVQSEDGLKLLELGEALEQLELPDEGDFTYACEVEIKPTFELPELKGIEIHAPAIEITDAMIDQHILRQRKIGGRFEPAEGAAAGEDDLLIADVTLTVDGKQITHEDNVQLGVRPTRLDGIPLLTLADELRGAKAGDERRVEAPIPDDYVRPDLRGKTAIFEFKVHEIKRLEPLALEAFVEQMGLASEQELRDAVRQDMELERDRLIGRAQKEQVLAYLLDHVALDVPEGLSARQTDRAVMRRVIELQQQGMPEDEIEAKIDELRTTARDEVVRDLKLEFIMEKVAEQLGVRVSEEELNTEIALIARRYGKRFDRIRDDLAQRGLLGQLAEQIRQDKCVQMLLAHAKMLATPPAPAAEGKPAAPAAKPKARKKSASRKKSAGSDTE